MLKDDFFKVIQVDSDGSTIKAELELNADHKIFEGHFPGTPVVPGVCMLQMVKEIVEMNFDRTMLLSNADSMKFLSVVNPRVDKIIMAAVSWKTLPGLGIDVSASISVSERVCFKFKGMFIVAN